MRGFWPADEVSEVALSRAGPRLRAQILPRYHTYLYIAPSYACSKSLTRQLYMLRGTSTHDGLLATKQSPRNDRSRAGTPFACAVGSICRFPNVYRSQLDIHFFNLSRESEGQYIREIDGRTDVHADH